MQKMIWKLYSPMTADFFPQEVYDDPELMDREGPMELEGEGLAEYADVISAAIEKEDSGDEDLAQYLHGENEAVLKGKVLSIVPSVEVVGDELMGCATVKLREPLNEQETAVLRDYLTGQYSDGWGESFEQMEIEAEDGVLFVHFWNSEQFHIALDRNPVLERESALAQAQPVYKRPKMKLVGEDGNIFAILGRASRLLYCAGQEDQAKEMVKRVTASYSYSDALFIVSEYVETELSEPSYSEHMDGEKQKGGNAR